MWKFACVFLVIASNRVFCKVPKDGLDSLYKDHMTKASMHDAIGEVIRGYMNLSADPCQDFYNYACGNFVNFTYGDDSPPLLARAVLLATDRNKAILLDLLNADLSTFNERPMYQFEGVPRNRQQLLTQAEMNVRKFYESCKNADAIKNRESSLIGDYLHSFPEWPLEYTERQPFDWIDFVARLKKIDQDILLQVKMDLLESINYDIIIDGVQMGSQLKTGISEDEGHSICMILDIEQIQNTLNFTGMSKEQIDLVVEDIAEFDDELSEIAEDYDSKSKEKKVTIQELQEAVPEINWLRYLTLVLDHHFTSDHKVYVKDLDYLKKLGKLIDKTSELKLKRYLMFRLVNALPKYTKEHKYYIELESRDDHCLELVTDLIEFPATALFLRHRFSEDIDIDIRKLAQSILDEFIVAVESSTLIDEASKQGFVEKVRGSQVGVGYWTKDQFNKEVFEKFGQLEIIADKYFENVLQVLAYKHQMMQSKVGNIFLLRLPTEVNAFYSPENNSTLVILAGIAQPPMYNIFYPGFAKYGRLGTILGHEMGHGFDVNNFFYDKLHKVESRHGSSTYINYFVHALCLSRQYSNYSVDEDLSSKLDGIKTVAENIADNMGVSMALKAYEKWLQQHPEESVNENVSGLNLSPVQLFLLGFAQNWCHGMATWVQKILVEADEHTLDHFRILGTLSNSKAFHDAYRCPLDTPMNPKKKCLYD